MARKMEKVSTTPSTTSTGTSSKQPTAAEMREWYEKNKGSLERFEEAQDGLINLKDITKNQTKTVSAFSKETLRQYLRNIGSNEKNLRNLSRYLYYRCQPYYRLISYNANMFELGARTVVPDVDLAKMNASKIQKSYFTTLNMLDKMNLQLSCFAPLMTCFREDVFYGMAYYDETGFWILPLDPDYCKIAAKTDEDELKFAMDMTWFRSRQEVLEYWGEPFQTMYDQYESDNQKWQMPPEEYLPNSICWKFRLEDLDIILPPFVGLFNSIINLIDLEDITAIADAASIYKLIFLEMETLSGTKNENDWKISPSVMIEYFNRMISEALPDYVSAALVPGELKSINLNDTDKNNDTNKIVKAQEALFNGGGGSFLNGATISGTTAFTVAIEADTQFAISSLLPQIQTWVNRFLKATLGEDASKVKFMEISAFTKKAERDSMLASCQNGFSNKIAYNTLNGLSEKDTIAMNFLENEVLHITDSLIPLSTSYTQSSSDTGGRPKSEDGDLTDEGEASRDKSDSAGY